MIENKSFLQSLLQRHSGAPGARAARDYGLNAEGHKASFAAAVLRL
jgi:hypothetical protein